jgi:hypothetical protein
MAAKFKLAGTSRSCFVYLSDVSMVACMLNIYAAKSNDGKRVVIDSLNGDSKLSELEAKLVVRTFDYSFIDTYNTAELHVRVIVNCWYPGWTTTK